MVTQKVMLVSQVSEHQVYQQSLKKDQAIIIFYHCVFNLIVKVEV